MGQEKDTHLRQEGGWVCLAFPPGVASGSSPCRPEAQCWAATNNKSANPPEIREKERARAAEWHGYSSGIWSNTQPGSGADSSAQQTRGCHPSTPLLSHCSQPNRHFNLFGFHRQGVLRDQRQQSERASPRCDWQTPATRAARWEDTVKSPQSPLSPVHLSE